MDPLGPSGIPEGRWFGSVGSIPMVHPMLRQASKDNKNPWKTNEEYHLVGG